LRPLGEGPVNTCAGFAWSGDGLTHAQFVKQMAEEGHTPSIALLKDGALVAFVPRHQIEGRSSEMVAAQIAEAIEAHCETTV